MAITRTAMIDDDGTGTTGTVINAAWKTELYGQIDAKTVNPLLLAPTLAVPMALGQFDNWRPTNGASSVVWLLQPSVATGITGILAEADGTSHLLINGAGVNISFYNLHGSSSAGNLIICPGYGASFVLAPWYSIWVVYIASVAAWIMQAPRAGALLLREGESLPAE
jgi:hypothetical protein